MTGVTPSAPYVDDGGPWNVSPRPPSSHHAARVRRLQSQVPAFEHSLVSSAALRSISAPAPPDLRFVMETGDRRHSVKPDELEVDVVGVLHGQDGHVRDR